MLMASVLDVEEIKESFDMDKICSLFYSMRNTEKEETTAVIKHFYGHMTWSTELVELIYNESDPETFQAEITTLIGHDHETFVHITREYLIPTSLQECVKSTETIFDQADPLELIGAVIEKIMPCSQHIRDTVLSDLPNREKLETMSINEYLQEEQDALLAIYPTLKEKWSLKLI